MQANGNLDLESIIDEGPRQQSADRHFRAVRTGRHGR
eukprot:ctg_5428.g476